MDAIQIEVYRGQTVESTHLVDAVVLDENGECVATFGEPERVIFTRSLIKPIQALPLMLSGGYESAPAPLRAVSIACASHSAEAIHTETVESWLASLGLNESNLICGAARTTHAPGKRKINHNCSGKHTGMLATCVARGWDIATYHQYDHPIQKEIRDHFSVLGQLDVGTCDAGVDGCGLPTYAMPLKNIARAMSHFNVGRNAPSPYAPAITMMHEAWRTEPWMISGHGGIDSELLAATDGRVFSKVGAEAGYIALLPEQSLTLALKARDGAFRACEAALFALLKKYGNLSAEVLKIIEPIAVAEILNAAGESVGATKTIFV